MEESDKKKIRKDESQISDNNKTISKCNDAISSINSAKPGVEKCLEYVEKIKSSATRNLQIQKDVFDVETLDEVKNYLIDTKNNISNANKKLDSKIQSLKSANNELQYKIRKIKKESGDS